MNIGNVMLAIGMILYAVLMAAVLAVSGAQGALIGLAYLALLGVLGLGLSDLWDEIYFYIMEKAVNL